MTFQDLRIRALFIRHKYSKFEKHKYGKEWTKEQLVQGFAKDVEDLINITSASENTSDHELKTNLKHELADCLWSVIVIAEAYKIDLPEAFTQTMDELEKRLEQK